MYIFLRSVIKRLQFTHFCVKHIKKVERMGRLYQVTGTEIS